MAAMVQDLYNSAESDGENEMLTSQDLNVGLVRAPAPLLRLRSCKNQEFNDRTASSHTLLAEVSGIITQSRTFQRPA